MVFMGEGASNEGDVHEALNFVGIHDLPMIFVVENNGYAISVPVAKECAVTDVAIRAEGYGMPGVVRRRDGRAGVLSGGARSRRCSPDRAAAGRSSRPR